jgi:hypothetical protein
MSANGWSEIGAFWIKVLGALSRLVALTIFLLAHYGLNQALRLVFPSQMTSMLALAEDAVGITFILIYVYLSWDLLTVFIPKLKRPEARTVTEPADD